MVPPLSTTNTLPITVLAGVGDNGQPQWILCIAAPLATQAVAALCAVVTLQGGVIRSIAFVATVPAMGEEATTVRLSPQLQLKVQGATLATEVLQDAIATVLAL
ncbi:MAG: hypothetical protein QE263_01685 [Vampirovibrionales bacterium]|nr:hypothetical protein [Vampirovibrionales bacterium]